MHRIRSGQHVSRRWTVGAVAVAVMLGPLLAISPGGADSSLSSQAQLLVLPVGAQNATPSSYLNSVSCSATTCVAAGSFTDVNGAEQAVTETSSDGGLTWSTGVPVTFAVGEFDSFLNEVSCSGSTCAAVGTFSPNLSSDESFTVSSSNGGLTWTDAQPVNFANGVLFSQTIVDTGESVSCSGSTCVAVGLFVNAADQDQGFTVSSSNGGQTWTDAQPVVAVSTRSGLQSVSCTGVTCVVAGYAINPSNTGYGAVTSTSVDAGNTWSALEPVNLPSGDLNPAAPYSFFESVSCSGATCVAGGYFYAVGGFEGMTESSSDGGLSWSNPQFPTFASGVQNASPYSLIYSVSCSGSTCVTGGEFLDAAGNFDAMTESSGDGGVTWTNAEPIGFAPGVQSASPNSSFLSVSCSGLICAAGGQFADTGGSAEAMSDVSSDGGASWATAQPASFAPGVQNTSPHAQFNGVSCFESNCVAAGQFTDVNGFNHAMTVSDVAAASGIAHVTDLAVTQSGSVLAASWSPVAGATTYTCTLLFGFNDPSTFTSTTSGPSCSFVGLSATTPYGVAVVANGVGVTSTSESAFPTPMTSTTTTTLHKTPPPRRTTIVCVRRKTIRRIRGVHPTCPAGFKRKK
jgi:hypothetical protein